MWYTERMAPRKPDVLGTQEDLISAVGTVMAAFDATPLRAYMERCQGTVARGICGAEKQGPSGRYPCGNGVGKGGVFCPGPCVPVWIFT